MKMISPNTIFLLNILFFIFANECRTQQFNEHGFNMELSSNWKKISTKTIPWPDDERLGKTTLIYCYIQQSGENLPKILIRKNEGGRIPYTKLCKSYEFDPSALMMRINLEQEVPGYGDVHLLTAVFPTERGFIAIDCFAKVDDYERKYKDSFTRIINSVSFSSFLEYKKRWYEIEFLQVFNNTYAIIATVLTIIYIVSVLKKKPIKITTPEEYEERRAQRKKDKTP